MSVGRLFRFLAVAVQTRARECRAARFARQRVQPVRTRRAQVTLDDRSSVDVSKLFALPNAPRIRVVLRFARDELHRQEELERNEADVVASDAYLASGANRILNGFGEQRAEMKSAVDEVDANAASAVAQGNANGNGKVGILRGTWNAPRIQRKASDQRERHAAIAKRGRRQGDRWPRIERLDLADDEWRLGIG